MVIVEKMSSRLSASDRSLNEREWVIITARCMNDDSITPECLGNELGILKELVRQIEHAARGKLKKALIGIVGDPFEAGMISGV